MSTDEVISDVFFRETDRKLGDTGNDMIIYGGKVYIVVNVSSTVEVMNLSDLSPIKQISMIDNGIAKQPRSAVGYNGKLYVTCYDGFVDVIDTITLTITNRIAVGSNPECLVVENNKLYVSNSGGLNYPNVDSTVSVVDLVSEIELSKISVGLNPGDMESDGNGGVYVISRGDYSSIPSRMHKIDAVSDLLVMDYNFDASEISPFGSNQFLIPYSDFATGLNSVGLFDIAAGIITNGSFLDVSNVESIYETTYNPQDDKIYLSDALNFTTTGYVRQYSSAGSYIKSFHVGLNPSKIIFYD
jgi:YVTN family beta-propeller protein